MLVSKSIEHILICIRKEMPYLKSHFQIKTIGVFGSYARDNASEKSDLDILVEYDISPGFIKFIQLEDFLSKLLNIEVDLVSVNALNDYIRPSILAEIIYA